MQAQNVSVEQGYTPLPLRAHTILGVCEAIGEDFGFNPVLLRIPFAASVLWSPTMTFAAYFALGAAVLASRLLFPRTKQSGSVEAAPARAKSVAVQSDAPVLSAANEQAELANAA